MIERVIELAPEDIEEIGVLALQCAKAGVELIEEIENGRVMLAARIIKLIDTTPASSELNDNVGMLRYELFVMGEVARQAKAIRQVLGYKDDETLLEELRQELAVRRAFNEPS